jgi:nucleoside-diphosphate-sugar epimerase
VILKSAKYEDIASSLSTKLVTAVVGADGFVGAALADALKAHRVVYGPPRTGEIHVSQAKNLLKKCDVILNAGGFRVRPGCTYADYQRSHQGATSAFVPWVRKGALFIHMSSASVLGKSRDQSLGSETSPNPKTFPSPAYAMAKLEADQYLEKAAAEHDFRLIFLRPAVVYSMQGAGMVGTVLKLAKRGIILRLYPRGARHHFCHMNLLIEVACRVIEQHHRLRHLTSLVVADPYTVSNRHLDTMIQQSLSRKALAVPVPVNWISTLLGWTFHSRDPKLDLRTWGEIFGVLNLDTPYDPSQTFELLGVDPAQYALDQTLLPLIQETLRR